MLVKTGSYCNADIFQNTVAESVTEGIVRRFELINVKENHNAFFINMGNAVFISTAVEQFSQFISLLYHFKSENICQYRSNSKRHIIHSQLTVPHLNSYSPDHKCHDEQEKTNTAVLILLIFFNIPSHCKNTVCDREQIRQYVYPIKFCVMINSVGINKKNESEHSRQAFHCRMNSQTCPYKLLISLFNYPRKKECNRRRN